MADAVPILDIPTTLTWEPKERFGGIRSGMATLIYTVLVILPVLGLIGQFIDAMQGRRRDYARETPPTTPV